MSQEEELKIALAESLGFKDGIRSARGELVLQHQFLNPKEQAAYEAAFETTRNLTNGYERCLDLEVELASLRQPSPKQIKEMPCGWFSQKAAQDLYESTQGSAWIPVHEYLNGSHMTTHLTEGSAPPSGVEDAKFLGRISAPFINFVPSRWFAPR